MNRGAIFFRPERFKFHSDIVNGAGGTVFDHDARMLGAGARKHRARIPAPLRCRPARDQGRHHDGRGPHHDGRLGQSLLTEAGGRGASVISLSSQIVLSTYVTISPDRVGRTNSSHFNYFHFLA